MGGVKAAREVRAHMAWPRLEQPLVLVAIATAMLAVGGDGEAEHDGCQHEAKLMDKMLAEQKRQLIQQHNAEKAGLREALQRSDERFAKLQMELGSIRQGRAGTSSTGGLEPHAWSRLTAPQGPLGESTRSLDSVRQVRSRLFSKRNSKERSNKEEQAKKEKEREKKKKQEKQKKQKKK